MPLEAGRRQPVLCLLNGEEAAMGVESPETERIVVPEPQPLQLPAPDSVPDSAPVGVPLPARSHEEAH